MKRLMIPVGAGILALAGTVALALGPNSSTQWGVERTAGGALSVQRTAVFAGYQTPGGAAQRAELPDARTPTVVAETTAAAEPTPEPGRMTEPDATKDPASAAPPVTALPKSTPTLVEAPAPTLPPILADPVKSEPAATKPLEPRAAKDGPSKLDKVPEPSLPQKSAEPAKDSPATSANARTGDRAR